LPDITEVTLRQWIDSVWFRGLSRAAMLLSTFVLMAFAGAWAMVAGDTTKRVVALEKSVAAVSTVQTARAVDSESFQTEVRGNIVDVKNDLFKLKVDIGVVKGILQQMQQRNEAAAKFSMMPSITDRPER
jgi:hypothetical protein